MSAITWSIAAVELAALEVLPELTAVTDDVDEDEAGCELAVVALPLPEEVVGVVDADSFDAVVAWLAVLLPATVDVEDNGSVVPPPPPPPQAASVRDRINMEG